MQDIQTPENGIVIESWLSCTKKEIQILTQGQQQGGRWQEFQAIFTVRLLSWGWSN